MGHHATDILQKQWVYFPCIFKYTIIAHTIPVKTHYGSEKGDITMLRTITKY